MDGREIPKGRGSGYNPPNRYERIELLPDPEFLELGEDVRERTRFYRDSSRSIISHNDSPDLHFDVSINPYRGCEHGCVYCYARPFHEYLGYSQGLDFETKILVKHDAPALLRTAMMKPSWTPQVLMLAGVTDPYQPAERRFRLVRGCLEVLSGFGNPVQVVTKNHLVERDIDLLAALADRKAAAVMLSIPTLDTDLAGRLEPRCSRPERRLQSIARLNEAGIPAGVLVAPVIPGLTEHEIPAILEAAAESGARTAVYIALRLPGAVSILFENWLRQWYPERADRVLNRVRDMRHDHLNDARFGTRMRGEGAYAEHISTMFHAAMRRHGLSDEAAPLSTEAFQRPGGQIGLF